jgi:very-short-patch-repair endonuclease
MRKAKNPTRDFARVLRGQMSNAEVILWSHLRRRGLCGCKFRRQHPIGAYIADFACVPARLVIEVDGATHGTDLELAYDARRDAFMRSIGWKILRFTNGDIYEELDGVIERIAEELL